MNPLLTLLLCFLFLTQNGIAQEAQKKPEPKEVTKDEMKKIIRENPDAKTATFGAGDFNPGHLSVDNSDAALIVFTVIGLVVVVAWIPYFPVLAYKALKGDRFILGDQHLLLMTGLGGSNKNLSSVRYSLYLQDIRKTYEVTSYGLAAEAGFYNYQKDEGQYAMLGPSLHFFRQAPLFARLDLLAGTSFDSNLGLMSRADAMIGYMIFPEFSLQMGLGAFYANAKNATGIAGHGDHQGLLFNFGLGYRW